MTAIKFCGLTVPGDAAFAASLNASYAGVIFAQDSRRRVDSAQARAIFDAGSGVLMRVGVFRSQNAGVIAAIASAVHLDVVQLHDSFDRAEIVRLRTYFSGLIWIVAGVTVGSTSLDRQIHDIASDVDGILLDTSVAGISGGSGQTFDWSALRDDALDLQAHVPVLVAGGLHPENVGAAIGLLSPAAVDVSSGVESSPGIKDHSLMRSFAEAVASASSQQRA